jgi:acetoin utilization protein AcuB
MLIADCMTRHPVLAPLTLAAPEAQKLMVENRVRHMPVVESGKRLAGLLTSSSFALKTDTLSSLNMWEITRYLADLSVAQIMVKAKDVVTITPDRTVERAAALMSERKIGCLPVVEEGQIVVGVVTENDLLRSFQEMLGLPSEGVRVTVRMPDRHGEFVKLMRVFVECNWGVMGIGTFPARRRPGYYDAVVKVPGVTVDEVRSALAAVPEQEIVDIRVVV